MRTLCAFLALLWSFPCFATDRVDDQFYTLTLPEGWKEVGKVDASAPLVAIAIFGSQTEGVFSVVTGHKSLGLTANGACLHEVKTIKGKMTGDIKELPLTEWNGRKIESGYALTGHLSGLPSIMRVMAFSEGEVVYVIIEGGPVELVATEAATKAFASIRASFQPK